MSWIDEKAWNGLSLVREVREQQVYPHFRPYETGGVHAMMYGKPVQRTIRSTVVIGPKGDVIKHWPTIKKRTLPCRGIYSAPP